MEFNQYIRNRFAYLTVEEIPLTGTYIRKNRKSLVPKKTKENRKQRISSFHQTTRSAYIDSLSLDASVSLRITSTGDTLDNGGDSIALSLLNPDPD